ncbi:MAG: HAMP domain-containing protein [Ignavibacteriae bacterium]|nr:MAG: HAMP domain-containing protein [Ignavibacteriota bacterium]
MTILHSIRTKLSLWYAAILVVTLLGSGAIAYVASRSSLRNNLDYSLKNEVEWVNAFIEPKAKKVKLKRAALKELQELKRSAAQQEEQPEVIDTSAGKRTEIDEMWSQIYQHTLLSPRRHYIQILDRNGDLLYRSQSLRGHTLSYNDIPYQWINVVSTKGPDNQEIRLALTQNDYVKIFVAYPLEPVYEITDNVFYNFLFITPFALLISIIGGWFLAHKSLKPVDELTKTAKEITAQNLNRRLPANVVDDELGRLTEQFNDMISRLQASFDQIQQFSADASHELRTPLTIMRGEIEVAIRNQRLSKSTRELLMSINDELVRLSSIVESLMILVKSDTGRLVFTMQPIALNEFIEQLVEETKMLAETKKIKVKLDLPQPIQINGDAVRLKQLFLNLIDNALKYTPPRGQVVLTLSKKEGEAILAVKDNGIGIPKKDQAKIFERFYRVERSGEHIDDAGGSGLGLSIAQWITEAHHGSIEVKSREGRGSTFVVRLPIL